MGTGWVGEDHLTISVKIDKYQLMLMISDIFVLIIPKLWLFKFYLFTCRNATILFSMNC